jgi:hypothetical protein
MEDEDSKLDRRVKHSEKRPEKLDSLQGPTMRTETQDQSTSPKGEHQCVFSVNNMQCLEPALQNLAHKLQLQICNS